MDYPASGPYPQPSRNTIKRRPKSDPNPWALVMPSHSASNLSSTQTNSSPGNPQNSNNNQILTSLSHPSMAASYPSTSEKSIFITPAIGRHKFVAGLDRSPKKSILKRPHSYGPSSNQSVAFEPSLYNFGRPLAMPGTSQAFEDQEENVSPRSQQRSVGFSEKNTVAIFGDTSDDNTTETENDTRKLVAAVAAANMAMSRIPVYTNRNVRQTSILSSEDDTDSPSQPMMDSHENTPFDEDDLITEESDAATLKNGSVEDKTKANAVVGLSPHEEDQMSYASSNASSIITGKWWFGKDNRYVTHCDKKGCNHKHSTKETSPGAYLTPTQQKNKEIARLKKELKRTTTDLEEKELHLRELRERVKEIDTLMDNNLSLKENSKLMQRQKELQDEFKQEKKELVDRHDLRVRQLIQEAVDARTDAARKTEQLDNFSKLKRERLVDAEMMTDPVFVPAPPPPQSQLQAALASLAPSPKPGDEPETQEEEKERIQQYQSSVVQETVNQLQAYQNEALVWRTKAAQLEMIVKDHLAKSTTAEAFVRQEIDQLRHENDKLKDYCHRLEASALADSIIEGDRNGMLRSMDSVSTGGPLLHSASSVGILLAADCQSPACVERTRLLNDENRELIDTLEEKSIAINDLGSTVFALKNELYQANLEIEALNAKSKELVAVLDEKKSECEAAQFVVSRLQGETDKLNQALSFLEERVQVYRNTILDNDLVVKDESSSEWRHGFADPRYSVQLSKQAQTDLTSDELNTNERDFVDLRQRLKEVQQEFSSKHKTLHEKFDEIEENLILKTNLVESLSKQLENAQNEIQKSHETRQTERETYQSRIDALARVAERVSFLENEYDRIKTEKSQLELRFEEMKEEYEEGLEDALNGSLRKYQEQSDYWRSKISQIELARDQAKNQTGKLQKEMEILRVKTVLGKAELEQRLTSSIDHVTVLNDQINVPKKDVQCDARPKQLSKYVSCKPNTKIKETEILKGDLFDEVEERLKLTQAELGITRRQVQVLQQKLYHPGGDLARGTPSLEGSPPATLQRLEKKLELDDANLVDLKENVKQLEQRNAELTSKLRQLELEQQEARLCEKERIQQLVTEFDNVRKELDDEIMKYENDRVRLKDRIKLLESKLAENQKLKTKIRQWDHLDKLLDHPRESFSLISDTDESDVDKAIEKFQDSMMGASSSSNSMPQEMPRSASFPTLLVTSADSDSETDGVFSENDKDRDDVFVSLGGTEKAQLLAELGRLKLKVEQSIRRTVSGRSKNSAGTGLTPSTSRVEPSPSFRNVNTELGQVQDELHRILEGLEAEATDLALAARGGGGPQMGEKKKKSSSKKQFLREAVKTETEIVRVVEGETEMALNELTEEHCWLKEELDDSRQKQQELRNQYDECMAELDMYRGEMAASIRARKGDPRFLRSTSSQNVNEGQRVTPQELIRWKETAGTTFREVNRLRKDCRNRTDQVEEMKTQVAILRGELAFAKAQQRFIQELSAGGLGRGKRKRRRRSLSASGSIKSFWGSRMLDSVPNLRKSLPDLRAVDVVPERDQSGKVEGNDVEKKDGLIQALTTESAQLKDEIAGLKGKNSQLGQLLEEKEVQLRRQKLAMQPLSRSDEAIPEKVENDPSRERMLVQEVELYEKKIRDMETEKQQMYLVMFKKGQQAAKHDIDEDKQVDQMTEDKIVLKFLHDAFYYYLLNRGNTREHLHAIMTMLNFTSAQKDEIGRRRGTSH